MASTSDALNKSSVHCTAGADFQDWMKRGTLSATTQLPSSSCKKSDTRFDSGWYTARTVRAITTTPISGRGATYLRHRRRQPREKKDLRQSSCPLARVYSVPVSARHFPSVAGEHGHAIQGRPQQLHRTFSIATTESRLSSTSSSMIARPHAGQNRHHPISSVLPIFITSALAPTIRPPGRLSVFRPASSSISPRMALNGARQPRQPQGWLQELAAILVEPVRLKVLPLFVYFWGDAELHAASQGTRPCLYTAL